MFRIRRRTRREQYPPDTCTRDVYNAVPWVPLGWGDAHQWADSAKRSGLTLTNIPSDGAVAVFSDTSTWGEHGHVALVYTVLPSGDWIMQVDDPPQLMQVEADRSPAPNSVSFILPPPDTRRRLPRGDLHNGQGAAVDVIVQVMQAYDDFRNYWNLRVGLQHDVLQIVNDNLGQYT